jgi:hypothetical protein
MNHTIQQLRVLRARPVQRRRATPAGYFWCGYAAVMVVLATVVML